MKITLAHSPDADDAFMFYGLATGKIDTEGVTIVHELRDIQTLNEWAREGKYEITAISWHAYPEIQDKYAPLVTGGSFGEKDYGPMIVKRADRPFFKDGVIGVPGTKTTAFLLLRLWYPDVEYKVIPFDKIPQAVVSGEVDAGLLIHEGQLFYKELGLEEVVNFGKWWYDQYQMTLPLGGNIVRRDLSQELQKKIAKWLQQSFEYSLAHRAQALDHALQFARDLPTAKADQFVGMYVNERTIDMGDEGKKAVQLILDLGYKQKIISQKAHLDWIES
ncbi:MAG: MqnA/MqnD/SBP family protein [Deltaproteobacteria bacterium]|nr:MqnA/MqnD/SBP family protein [Deltaproteobacteria bacterium]